MLSTAIRHGWIAALIFASTLVGCSPNASQAGTDGANSLRRIAIDAIGTKNRPANKPNVNRPHLYIVAHQDDDLLFMNNDILNSIRDGGPVRTVYVTAGDGGFSESYWRGREAGVMAAYASMAGVASDWQCGSRPYAAKNVVICTLVSQPQVSLGFMRLPSDWIFALWLNNVPSLTTLGEFQSVYNRAEVIQVLSALIAELSPSRVGTQENSWAYGDDHSDHVASAFFALQAHAAYSPPHEMRTYRGYNIWYFGLDTPAPERRNLADAEYLDKLHVFESYLGATLDPDDGFHQWCSRRYAMSKLSGGTGPIVEPGGNCLDVLGGSSTDGTPVQASPCTDAPQQRWTIGTSSQIQGIADKCLTIAADGTSVQISTCVGSPQQKWTAMSSGQIHGIDDTCLSLGDDRVAVQASTCTGVSDPSGRFWVAPSQQWVQQFGTTSLWSSGAQFSDADDSISQGPSYYGTFQLADVNGDGYADACVRRSDGVYCALNARTGSFSPYTRWLPDFSDASGWQADQYGTTVQFADVNGDGKADVCGRSPAGIICATADASASAFVDPRRWSTGPDFSDTDPSVPGGFGSAATYYRSIRFADINGDGYADVCGRTPAGIRCALNNRAGGFGSSALWTGDDFTDALGWAPEQYGTTIQLGDINGDGRADVCGRGPSGIRCSLTNSSGTGFINPHFWSFRVDFSDADSWGSWATASSYFRSIRLADVNGDGYADLCGRGPSGIVCAISNGMGFDRLLPMITRDFADAQGWLADLYGSTIRFGDLSRRMRPDLCGRGPSGLRCALAP
jgi:hypothetical protein